MSENNKGAYKQLMNKNKINILIKTRKQDQNVHFERYFLSEVSPTVTIDGTTVCSTLYYRRLQKITEKYIRLPPTDQNPVLSDHFLITFEFTLLDYTASENNFTYRRCLSENAVTRFNFIILFFTAMYRYDRGRLPKLYSSRTGLSC